MDLSWFEEVLELLGQITGAMGNVQVADTEDEDHDKIRLCLRSRSDVKQAHTDTGIWISTITILIPINDLSIYVCVRTLNLQLAVYYQYKKWK